MKNKNQIQDEALECIGDKKNAGVEMSMGVGKTNLGLKHMIKNYTDISKFLVVAPKLSIFTSWKDDIEKFNCTHLNDNIYYSTYRSLDKQDTDYDIIYLDECHSLKHSHNGWLQHMKNKGAIIIGLTGTYPTKKYTEKGKLCEKFCPKVYTYKTDDAVEDKILNDYKIHIHQLKLDTNKTIEKSGKFGGFYTSEQNDYNYWTNRLEQASNPKAEQIARIQRMKAMQKFPSKEVYAKKLLNNQTEKTLIFANFKEQADNLCYHSVHSGNPKSKENLELFKKGDLNKLSTIEQLSEGVTIPNLKIGIIMHAYSNNRKTAQKLGRLLRLNPDDTALIHILCYVNSIDKEWVESALKSFDQNKIKWINRIY